MKRKEKAQQTRRRVMDHALAEFSAHGYRAASVNNMFDPAQGVSKGIIYHYFASKDELFLACAEECFLSLKAYIGDHFHPDSGAADAEEYLADYFRARARFFEECPLYQRIFIESVFMPPEHLQTEILERRRPMERMNTEILEKLLSRLPLRGHLDREKTAGLLLRFINFMNLQHHGAGAAPESLRRTEEEDRQILDIFLNGILERSEQTV